MMNKINTLLECQKKFLFNSEYKHGHLNEDGKLLYLSCKKTNKVVSAYIGEMSIDDSLVIYELKLKNKITKKVIFCYFTI